MSKYMLVYTGGKMPESEKEQKKVLKEWETWYAKSGHAIVDQGNPFSPIAKNISSDGRISDGSMDCMASGYSLIMAEFDRWCGCDRQRLPGPEGRGEDHGVRDVQRPGNVGKIENP